ncbi:MliC family protein [Moraxella nasovis]|uniref:MliC family protein n=1 Tax=Moraxella nasovis TaxID=2904121 RepID=UPI001F61DCE7|nr:MliC family protein [Moraxella nasovis]UNU72838.1 MliC family protein [Moraxella nasovis]
MRAVLLATLAAGVALTGCQAVQDVAQKTKEVVVKPVVNAVKNDGDYTGSYQCFLNGDHLGDKAHVVTTYKPNANIAFTQISAESLGLDRYNAKLKSKSAASGERYANDKIDWHAKGHEAVLTLKVGKQKHLQYACGLDGQVKK